MTLIKKICLLKKKKQETKKEKFIFLYTILKLVYIGKAL